MSLGDDIRYPSPEDEIAARDKVIKELQENLHKAGVRNGILVLKIRQLEIAIAALNAAVPPDENKSGAD